MTLLTSIQGPTYQRKEFSDMQVAEGPARIYLTTEDISTAQSCLEAYEATDTEKTLAAFQDGFLMANLWVQQVSFTLAERSILTPHTGDSFYHFFAGSAPVVANVSGTLINPAGEEHKQAMALAYKNILRLSAVAKMGISPAFTFTGCTMPGAMTELSFKESSAVEGAITIAFAWLLFSVISLSATATDSLTVG
jgi:hypothetical protein